MGKTYPAAFRVASWLILPALTLMLVSCTKTEPVKAALFDPTALSGTNALEQVRKFVEVGPRVSGSPGAKKAYDYINRRFDEMGIVPIIYQFTEDLPDGRVTFRNITGEIPGTTSNRIIIVSHYDTYAGAGPDFVGANDSGSSTGLLLELARIFSRTNHTGPGIIVAFVDGEEARHSFTSRDGLHGSRYLVNALKRNGQLSSVKAVIVLDMIGDSDLTVGIPLNSSRELARLVMESAREEQARESFSILPNEIIDDHVPFVAEGVRAIDIIDLQYGSKPGENDYWHTTGDTMDKLSDESLQIIGRVTIRVVNKLLHAQPTSPK